MTNTCTCLPGDCHGGHTIDVGPVTRFHEIPQTVSAIRWTGDNVDAIKTWVGRTSQGEPRFLLPDEVTGQWESPGLFNDSALEWESVYPGDWIVQRPDGVFTRCDHEVFTATHRPETDTITAGPAWVCVADERLRQLRDDPDVCTNPGERSMADELLAARARITELEAATPKITSETSDGYHTFSELYRYRMLYNAALFNEWAAAGLYDVHKSVRHSDGSVCFDGNWFVVYAQLPTGQISNHYEIADWYKFRVPIRNEGVEWDGHTPQEAAERLAALLEAEHHPAAQPYREVWSDEVPPGGMVCSICGGPVESEPCPQHAPAERLTGWAAAYTYNGYLSRVVNRGEVYLSREVAEQEAAEDPTLVLVRVEEVTAP